MKNKKKKMIHDWASNVLAEVSNVGLHFIHPLTDYYHSCSCLLCASFDSKGVSGAKTKRPQTGIKHLVPMATPSDLDLIKTGSNAIRQLVVLQDEGDEKKHTGRIYQFIADLKSHFNYQISYNLPTIDPKAPFHVLVILVCDHNTLDNVWLSNALQHSAKRVVLITPKKDTLFTDPKLTTLEYIDFDKTLRALNHGSMITKQRLMATNLQSLLSPHTDCVITAPQPGLCLFL